MKVVVVTENVYDLRWLGDTDCNSKLIENLDQTSESIAFSLKPFTGELTSLVINGFWDYQWYHGWFIVIGAYNMVRQIVQFNS